MTRLVYPFMLYLALLTLADFSRVVNSASLATSSSWHQRLLQALDRFEIGEPKITFTATVIQLIFPLSDQVPDGSVSTLIFSDIACSVDITVNDFLVPTVEYDDNPNPDATKNRSVTIRYDIDPIGIQESDVWVQDDEDQFFMNFCMSIRLHDGDAETSQVSGTLETIVRLQVDLLGDFGDEVAVLPNDPNSESVLQKYLVEGYICDDNLQEIIYMAPLVEGSKIRVCVKPTDDALADGVYMRRVDSFTYYRDNVETGGRINQVALLDGETANPALTEHFCERGWKICYFDTLLNADFYFKAGQVFGYGEAWLQYGVGPARKLQLRIDSQRTTERSLQEEQIQVDGGFAGSAQFSISFFVSPDSEFSFGAIAYECDNTNQKVPNPMPKRLGSSVRVCVTPDEQTQEYGLTINSINSWNWTRAETSSFLPVVQLGGEQAENGLSILLCVSGSSLCVIRTQYTDDFYKKDGTANGIGDVVLQFEPVTREEIIAVSRRARRYTETSSSVVTRSLQQNGTEESSSVGLIAGTSRVTVNINVANYRQDLPEECQYDQKLTEWWTEESIRKRYMYIGVAGGILSAIACSFLWCWCFPCLAKRVREDETKIIEEGNGDIKVDVDIKSGKEKTIFSHTRKTTSSRNLSCDETDVSGDSDRSDKKPSGKSHLDLPDGSADGLTQRNDIRFGDPSHPGTRKLLKVIQRFQRDSPDEPFDSHAYRLIKKDLDNDVRYFKEDSMGRYVEVSKKETVKRLGELYRQAKDGTLQRTGSSISLNDLEGKTGDHESRRKSKISKRAGSLNRLDDVRVDIENQRSSGALKKSSSSRSFKVTGKTFAKRRSSHR